MDWEYKCEIIATTETTKMVEKFNGFGKEKWELVAVVTQETVIGKQLLAFFKRTLEGVG